MSMWHTVLQDASFKGVYFDVLSIDERGGKQTAEHAIPFENGSHIEEMGNEAREVNISAVFFGKQYSSRLLELLNTLEEPGAGVLIHPVWGRMINMMPVSWSYRHSADDVDCAFIDITFRESMPSQPFFVFENHFLMSIERTIGRIDAYRSALDGFIDSVFAIKSETSAAKGSVLALHSAAMGSFAAIRKLFDFDELLWPFALRKQSTNSEIQAGFQNSILPIFKMIESRFDELSGSKQQSEQTQSKNINHASTLVYFNRIIEEAAAIQKLKKQIQNEQQNTVSLHRKSTQAASEVFQMIDFIVLCSLYDVSVGLIEKNSEKMRVHELKEMNFILRQKTQAAIAKIRQLEKEGLANQKDTLSYIHVNQVIESLRNLASDFNRLVIAAMNKRPPLIVRAAPISGTMQQIAFELYRDINRTDELIWLNPHITHPTFVSRNTLLNAYAK